MNNKVHNTPLLILVLISISVSVVWSQECFSNLEIKTSGKGVLIYLDNDYLGTDSVKTEVREGKYDLLLVSGAREWDSEFIRDTINIEKCDTLYTITKTLPRKIFLNTKPADAYVYGNDSLLGSTPLFLHKKYTSLRLEKPKFETAEIPFPDPNSKTNYNLKNMGGVEEEKFLDTPWFKVLFGSAVIFGSVAAYYKIKADNEFEIYSKNGNKSNLDTTERYDFYSGTAFGLLQINFAALLYFFLTD